LTYLHTSNNDERLGIFTIKSFGEDEHGNAEKDEEINNLLAMILDVMSNIFDEDCSSCCQLDARFSGSTERVVLVETADAAIHTNRLNITGATL